MLLLYILHLVSVFLIDGSMNLSAAFNEEVRCLVSHSLVFKSSVFSVSKRQNNSIGVMASAEPHLLAPPYIPLFVLHKWGTIDEMSSLEAR